QFVHDDATEHFDDGFRAVDARIVILLQGTLQRLKGLLQHRRIAPMHASFANTGAPIQTHWGTRSWPERRRGSSASRIAARVAMWRSLFWMRSSIGAATSSN